MQAASKCFIKNTKYAIKFAIAKFQQNHLRIRNVMNIEDNLFLKKLINKKNETFNHVHDIFKLNENEIEINCINSMNIVKKLKK